MSLREKLIQYQNQSEENFKQLKSLANTFHYLIAFSIFMVSSVVAGLTMPFRMLSKRMSEPTNDVRIVHLDKDNKDQYLKNNELLLLDFWAEWCGPCIMMNPVIKEFVERSEGVTIAKVNADVNPAIVKEFNVRGLPTFVLVKKGKEMRRHAGPMTVKDLEQFCQEG
jgi:thioredoxin 1